GNGPEEEPQLPQPPRWPDPGSWRTARPGDPRRGGGALRHRRSRLARGPTRRLAEGLGGLGCGQGDQRAARLDRGEAQPEVRRQRQSANPALSPNAREGAATRSQTVETVTKCCMTPQFAREVKQWKLSRNVA